MKTQFAVPSGSKPSIKILQHLRFHRKPGNSSDADSSFEVISGSLGDLRPLNSSHPEEMNTHPQASSTPYYENLSESETSDSDDNEPALFLNEANIFINKCKEAVQRKNIKKLKCLKKLERYRLKVYKMEVRLRKIENVLSLATEITKIREKNV